jgi:hypothetical protein
MIRVYSGGLYQSTLSGFRLEVVSICVSFQGFRFRVSGLVLRVWGLGFGIWVPAFKRFSE